MKLVKTAFQNPSKVMQWYPVVSAILLMAVVPFCVTDSEQACIEDKDCVLEHEYCEDTDGDYAKDTCHCQYGFYFNDGKCWSEDESQLSDPCDSHPCMHGGDCASRQGDEFMCHCMAGYTGVTCEAVQPTVNIPELLCGPGTLFDSRDNKCSPCPLGTFSETSGRDSSCLPCPSDKLGVNATTRHPGAANQTQCVFNPTIESVYPAYGPVSGGTWVTVKFTHLDSHQVAQIQLGGVPCSVLDFNATSVTCVTSRHQSRDPVTGPLEATFGDSFVSQTSFNFTFMPDPAIESIDNFKTFISGGLTMTIRGQNLDSILSPQMKVTRFHKGDMRLFTSSCSVYNGSVMGCITPNMGDGMDHYLFSNQQGDQGQGADSGTSLRSKRAANIPTFNDRYTQFYAGFQLDGVTSFQNMSSVVPSYGQLLVYPDPVYYHFEEENMLKDFSPDDHTFLHIKGKYLTGACRMQDIEVTIGRNVCDVSFLATNQLTCRPPESQPEPEDTGHGPDRTPRVTVYVGNLIYVIGYLNYYNSQSGMNDAVIGAIVAIAVIIPLIIITFIVCICYRRAKASAHKKSQSMDSISANSNIYFEQDGRPYPTGSARLSLRTVDSGSSEVPLVRNAQRMARNMSSSVSPPSTPGLVSLGGDSFGAVYFSASNSSSSGYYDILEEISDDLRLTVVECQLDSARLTLGDMVGEGYFGKVYKGELTDNNYLHPKTVAVKTAQGQHGSLKDVTSFLEEAVVMKDFNHSNVLSLIGVILVQNKPFVVLPFMEHGDLKSYIKEPSRRIKVRDLLAFGVQIADGMCYLANQKFVHRDLATRNCMIDKSLVLKIADFGLSRDIYKSDYYRVEDKHRPLPVKWMAVESLTSGIFSTKSDVWSYGVVVWELLTRGCTPYPDVSTFNIKAYVLSGRRLSQPEHAPSDVYELMCRCWMESPEERPSFDDLYNDLKEIINDKHTTNRPDYLQLVDA